MPKPKNPEILVIIPTLGQRINLLQQTFQSVVNQKPVLFDIVVICPKKSTETRKLSKEYGAAVIDDPGGLSAAVNAGINYAKPWHKYISWIGDDDLLLPGSLATSLNALKNNPDAVLAYGFCDYIDDKDSRIFTSRAGRLAPWLMTWGPNLVPLPGILFRLTSVKKVGGFDENLQYSMDLDILLKLRKIGSFINTKRALAAFRWHANSLTVSSRKSSLREAAIVKRRALPKWLQFFSPLWEIPVKLATRYAVRQVNLRATNHNKAT